MSESEMTPERHEADRVEIDPVKFPAILTVDEAAAIVRVNRKTIYNMAKRRKLPGCRRVGRCLRVHRDTLLAWLRHETADDDEPVPSGRSSRVARGGQSGRRTADVSRGLANEARETRKVRVQSGRAKRLHDQE